jgi:DoxX-like family
MKGSFLMSQSPGSDPAPAAVDPNRPSTAAFVTGWVLTILPAAFLIFSGVMKLIQPGTPEEAAKFLDPIGWKLEQLVGLGILELTCVIFYLIPQTAVLGAILATGYIGGIIATHVRIGDFGIIPFIMVGVLIWLGLFFRYPKLRRMIPFNF